MTDDIAGDKVEPRREEKNGSMGLVGFGAEKLGSDSKTC
jgi:hypothetical protein